MLEEIEDHWEVHTKSIPTAAALMVLTGHMPHRFRHKDGTTVFAFPSDAEPSFQKFHRAKVILDRLVERDRRGGAA
jgi:hypothetical protein